jgi:hypothetical protein
MSIGQRSLRCRVEFPGCSWLVTVMMFQGRALGRDWIGVTV